MTSNQVLELDLSAVQFEEVSDEKASIIQGGTGDQHGGNSTGNGDPSLPVLGFAELINGLIPIYKEFVTGLSEVTTLDQLEDLQQTFVDAINDLNL